VIYPEKYLYKRIYITITERFIMKKFIISIFLMFFAQASIAQTASTPDSVVLNDPAYGHFYQVNYKDIEYFSPFDRQFAGPLYPYNLMIEIKNMPEINLNYKTEEARNITLSQLQVELQKRGYMEKIRKKGEEYNKMIKEMNKEKN